MGLVDSLAMFGMSWPLWIAAAGLVAFAGLCIMLVLLRSSRPAGFMHRALLGAPTLRGRLLSGFRFIAIVPVLTLPPLLALIASSAVHNSQLSELDRLVGTISNRVPALVAKQVDGITALAGHIEASQVTDTAAVENFLIRHHTINPEFASLWVADRGGSVLVATAIDGSRARAWAGPAAGVSRIASFGEAIHTNRIFTSAVQIGANASKDPMIFVSTPLASARGEGQLFLQGLLNLRTIAGAFVQENSANGFFAVITDSRNRVILSSAGLVFKVFQNLDSHPLVASASTESNKGYSFSGSVDHFEEAGRFFATSRSLSNGWRVYGMASQESNQRGFLIFMAVGFIWALISVFLARGLAPMYGDAVSQPLASLDASLDVFDSEKTISIIPEPPRDAPQEIREVYERVRQSMRTSRDNYRKMVVAVNEGTALRQEMQENRSNTGGSSRSQDSMSMMVEESSAPVWVGETDTITQLPGFAVFDRLFNEAWSLGATDQKPLSIVLIGAECTDDAILQRVGKKLTESLARRHDVIARIDQARFGMILPETDLQGALSVAQKIQKSMLEVVESGSVTFGFGAAAMVPNLKGNAQSFLGVVERALVASLDNKLNEIAYYDAKGKLIMPQAQDSDVLDWETQIIA